MPLPLLQALAAAELKVRETTVALEVERERLRQAEEATQMRQTTLTELRESLVSRVTLVRTAS